MCEFRASSQSLKSEEDENRSFTRPDDDKGTRWISLRFGKLIVEMDSLLKFIPPRNFDCVIELKQ